MRERKKRMRETGNDGKMRGRENETEGIGEIKRENE